MDLFFFFFFFWIACDHHKFHDHEHKLTILIGYATVAERTKRPIFYIQAEDLGTNPAMLGAKLRVTFKMAIEWDAIILLDEADVFMAERDPHNITRNELVSIFLRELEYYRGIIFLTTNLYKTIDSAFRSRVSLHLLFKPLTVEARKSIWRKFLDRLPKPEPEHEKESAEGFHKAVEDVEKPPKNTENAVGTHAGLEIEEARTEKDPLVSGPKCPLVNVSEEDLEELAAWSLNGRGIQNAVKMVRSCCDYKGYDLTLERLENGIKVTSPHASKYHVDSDTSLYD
jgi:SpoVK/Ycf46/Vps4 family AAA+-type ATPase